MLKKIGNKVYSEMSKKIHDCPSINLKTLLETSSPLIHNPGVFKVTYYICLKNVTSLTQQNNARKDRGGV